MVANNAGICARDFTGTVKSPAPLAHRLRGVAAVALCLALGSCGSIAYNDYDTAGKISKQDYETLLGRRAPAPQARGDEPPIPNFQSVLAAPSAPALADTRRVSISVTETTPVRDILIELARKAQIDLEMDPRISGGIIMTATDRPFIDVIGRIAELAELRFKFEKNTLKVEVDDPYLEQYRMDVLNVARSGTSEEASSTDPTSVAAAVGSGAGGGGNNKSATSVTSSTKSDFWNTIGGNIDQILTGVQSRRGTARYDAGAAFIPEPAKEKEAAPAKSDTGGGSGGGGAGGKVPGAGLIGQAAALTQGRQQQLDAVLAADKGGPTPGEGGAKASASSQAADAAAPAGPAGAQRPSMAASQYSLNPVAGIITVFGTQRQQKAVERYLRDVRASVTQQVLIEAKVLEITLNDQFNTGINWNAVFGPNSGNQNLNVATDFSRNVLPTDFSDPTVLANWANGCSASALASGACRGPLRDLSLAVQMVRQFGTVRTLSSPRLTVLNNQIAQLKVAKNQVFFQLQVNVTDATATTAAKTTVNSQIKTVPVGLILSVMPAIDPTTRRISLSLRPSITRITSFINDPGVAVTIAVAQQNNANIPSINSPIPIIEVRELDSLVTMESGQTVVMGGLMQDTNTTTREGLPGVMDVPVLGQAASQNVRQSTVTELVVFIRATLANAPGTVTDEDIRLYKTFTPDPRPIAF